MFYRKILIPFQPYLASFSAHSHQPALRLASANQLSKAAVTLSSTASHMNGYSVFELQQFRKPNFSFSSIIYELVGRDSILWSLNGGKYFFKVWEGDGSCSTGLAAEIKHYSLQLTLILMTIGALVFISTIILV